MKQSRVNLNCFDDITSAGVFANREAGFGGSAGVVHRL